MNETIIKHTLKILAALFGLFLLIIARTFSGAFTGWVVGLAFSGAILGILDQIGLHSVSMWQFGALLGFVSGFFSRLEDRK